MNPEDPSWADPATTRFENSGSKIQVQPISLFLLGISKVALQLLCRTGAMQTAIFLEE
jgi:hypothetical protein